MNTDDFFQDSGPEGQSEGTYRKRRSSRQPPVKRKPKKKKFKWQIFFAGFLAGVIFTSSFSLLLSNGKEDPSPSIPPISGEENDALPTPEVNEIIIEEAKPEEVMEGRNHANLSESHAYAVEDVNTWMYEGRTDGKKTVFLTFDDGPGNYTREVLDTLKEKDAYATFFLLGNQADKTPASDEVWSRYMEEGHALALHSYSHDYDILYTDRKANVDKVLEEWDRSHSILTDIYGEDFKTRVLRFPGGAMSWKDMDKTKETLLESNIVSIDWNAMNGDSEPVSRRPATADESWEMIEDNLKRTRNSDTVVLLMHDTKEYTAEFLGEIIDRFRDEGYEFGILY